MNRDQSIIFEDNNLKTTELVLIGTWLRSKSRQTIEKYKVVINDFYQYHHYKSLSSITFPELQAFIDYKAQNKSAATQRYFLAVIKSLYSFAFGTGYLPVNLAKMLSAGTGSDQFRPLMVERYLSENEVSLLFLTADTAFEKALLALLYYGALRVGEAANLRWVDVSEVPGRDCLRLKIFGKGGRERVIVINSKASELVLKLRSAQPPNTNFVLSGKRNLEKKISERYLRTTVYKICERADFGKIISPHFLRHSHASHALDNGAALHDLRSTLGHRSINTTSIYLHSRPTSSTSDFLK